MEITTFCSVFEVLQSARNPEVHGIASNQFCVGHLVEHVELEVRGDIAKNKIIAVLEGLWNCRVKFGQYVELGFRGSALH